ncbi:MAG: ROK family protein [Burkholderiales bacterium]|nr:ROK family protein [Burkholderiales bacterium]
MRARSCTAAKACWPSTSKRSDIRSSPRSRRETEIPRELARIANIRTSSAQGSSGVRGGNRERKRVGAQHIRLGIDLGGTKIEIVALDDGGSERLRRRVPTPQGDYDATLAVIAGLVADAERTLGIAGGKASIGIGTPGSLSRATGLLRGSNSACLNGRRFRSDLETRVGREVRIANDANCFALSEAIDGTGAGRHVVFGAILGTGVGAGIVIDGRAWAGRNAIAGEWGHNPLPWPRDDERPGSPCYCGRHGCIETWLSGPAFERDHRDHSANGASTVGIVAAAAAGDRLCKASLERYAERLARALAHVINILDPDVIVLGGGMSNVEMLYAAVPALWAPWIFSDHVDTQLVRNAHGDSSGVRGAARLWPP